MAQSSKIIRNLAGVHERGRWAPYSAISTWVVIAWWGLLYKPLSAQPVYNCLQTCLRTPAVLSLFKCLHTCTFIACLYQSLSICTQFLPCPLCPCRCIAEVLCDPSPSFEGRGFQVHAILNLPLWALWEKGLWHFFSFTLKSLFTEFFFLMGTEPVHGPERPLIIVPASVTPGLWGPL